MVKIIIATNNDILFNSLSDIALKYEKQIEIINTPTDELSSVICQIKTGNLIILDSTTSTTFCTNIIQNAIEREVCKRNTVILVVDSNSLTNIINHEEKQHHSFFRRKIFDFSLFDVVNLVSNSLKESLDIEKSIDSILWQIGISSSLKGFYYIKDAISFTYIDRKLLLDNKTLVKKVSEKNNVSNTKLVRSIMDKTLNNALDILDTNVLYDIFEKDYDGRKISLGYFIDLCIRYLDRNKVAV